FETAGGDRHELIGQRTDDKKPGGNLLTTVGGNHDLHVKGGLYEGIDKEFNQSVRGDVVLDYHGNHALIVAAKSEWNAREIILEAPLKISLMVGGSFITLDPSGVTIGGPIVKINSGGAGTAVGNPTIGEVSDAAPADTGQPGEVDKVSGV